MDKSPSKKISSSSNQTSRHHSHESEINEDIADGYAMVDLNNVNVLQEKNMNCELLVLLNNCFLNLYECSG